uniref:Uncharacterized protein n=1 Tax=Cannabis sativa TaxID=3483 RepID=A0A803Q3N2_CANSA
MVDTWRVSHTKNLSSGFVDETTTENFGELRKELDRKRLERQSQSDTSGKVLGKRPNYQRCMGYRTKGKGKKLHSQSQSAAQLLSPNNICNIVADMFTTLRDTFGSRLTPERRAKLYNPRFDKFIQMYGQSQTPGGSSSQSYVAPSHQQHQPSLQQQQQQFGPQHGN